MYASISRFDSIEADSTLAGSAPRPQRVDAQARVSFKSQNGQTKLDRLYQTGAAKIRLPKSYSTFNEAVFINTSGGLTGGDRVQWNVNLAEDTKAVITTQASEKIYAASEGVAEVHTRIDVAAGATCNWLPQETILFQDSALTRSLDICLADSAKLLAVESVMLGRKAMGETLERCFFKDNWRIRRGNQLLFADDVQVDDRLADIQEKAALLNGQRCFATLIYSGGEDNERLGQLADKVNELLSAALGGASAFGGKLLVRLLAEDSYIMRQHIIPILMELSGNDLPKVWRL